MKNFGNNTRGRSQGVPKIFRTPMYRAHCEVIFAIAQLSCLMKLFCMSNNDIVNECRMNFGFNLPSEIIPTRIGKFLSKLSNAVTL